MTASGASPRSTRARAGASISSRRCSARTTGIAFDAAGRQPRQLVGKLADVARQREIGEPQEIAFGDVGADRVDRVMVELLGRMRRRVEVERELLQLLRDDRLVVAAASAIRAATGGAIFRPKRRPTSITIRSASCALGHVGGEGERAAASLRPA